MEEYTYGFVSVGVILLFWFFLHQYYSKSYKLFVKSFLDSNNNITIVSTEENIVTINKAGLDFFEYKSIQDFQSAHSSVSDLFLEEEGCINKYTYGKNWILKIEKSKRKNFKVKLFSKEDNMHYYFHVKISKMNYANSQYLLSFNNITDIEQEKQNIQKIAEYDPLTQIYNRVKFNDLLQEMFYKANRYNQPFSVILLDIDHFKNINDTYGHSAGDKVLVELARLINMSLRETDKIARWGGEEFVILSEHSSLEQSKIFAMRLKLEIADYNFAIPQKTITCSFGVTEFRNGDTQAKIFERVDQALYMAKENGRNQVVSK